MDSLQIERRTSIARATGWQPTRLTTGFPGEINRIWDNHAVNGGEGEALHGVINEWMESPEFISHAEKLLNTLGYVIVWVVDPDEDSGRVEVFTTGGEDTRKARGQSYQDALLAVLEEIVCCGVDHD